MPATIPARNQDMLLGEQPAEQAALRHLQRDMLARTAAAETKPQLLESLVDVLGDGTNLDSEGDPIYDPHPPTGSAGFDLDAIAVLRYPQVSVSLLAIAPETAEWEPSPAVVAVRRDAAASDQPLTVRIALSGTAAPLSLAERSAISAQPLHEVSLSVDPGW